MTMHNGAGAGTAGRRRAGCLLVLCAALCVPVASPGQTPAPCNPVVHLNVENASLSNTLRRLSQAHGFALEFPESVDRPVTLDADLPLDRLLKRLTSGVSTSWVYADHPACSGNRITRLIVYPVGQDAPLPRARGWQSGRWKQPVPEQGYIYVDDMEQYVRDVQHHRHRANLRRLTPEQRAEYRAVRKRLHKEFESEKRAAARKRPLSSAGKLRATAAVPPAHGD